MMGVYIKGVEMPKDGEHPCWVNIHSDGIVEYNENKGQGWQTSEAIPDADVVERPRWIPVTERLPGDDQRVLAYYGFDRGDGYLGMMFMQVLDYFARDPRPHFQHEGTNGMKVTHWMPLPEPPEAAP